MVTEYHNGYTSTDIQTDSNGDYIEIAHNLGKHWPTVAVWFPSSTNGWLLLSAPAVYEVDENTLRIYLSASTFNGPMHVRVVA